jgi:hypothetical protein
MCSAGARSIPPLKKAAFLLTWTVRLAPVALIRPPREFEGDAMIEDRINANRGGGSIATNVVDDGWGCGFLRVATKAISNGNGDANDSQDDATTNICPKGI